MKAFVAMPGGYLDDILNPEKLMKPMQIAKVLSKVCRWGGRGDHFYSVLQHSVELARALPKHLKIQGLIHDFSEAWIGDIPAPLKNTPEMRFLLEAEEALQKRIFEKYGGFSELDPLVAEYDSRIALDEAIMLGISGDWVAAAKRRPLGVKIVAQNSEEAFKGFMGMAMNLGFFGEARACGDMPGPSQEARPEARAARVRCK